MKRQLQERHKDIANHVGEDIADAQNALGRAIVVAQNEIGQSIFDSQNALGQAVVTSQNTNGEAIVDARNAMSTQHNVVVGLLCEVSGIQCNRFIGPLEEDQVFI